jgi:hypothetical protein
MFKTVFAGDKPMQLAMRGKPGIQKARKVDDINGYIQYYPIRSHLAAGVTHTFSDAQADETSNDIDRLGIQAKDTFVTVKLVAKEMALSRKDIGAYLRMKAKETEDRFEAFGQNMEREFWRGTHVGSVTAAPTLVSGSTYEVTLADPTDIVNIQKGMYIQCWDTADASSATQRAETGQVTKINHGTGKFQATFTGNPSAWGTNTDYLFVRGTRTASAILGWTGLNDYVPATDPSGSDSFQAGGLNRSTNVNYLAGWRGTQYSTIEETAQQLAVLMSPVMAEVAGSSEFWIHAKGFQTLQAEAGARLIRDQGGTADLGYTNVKIATAFGAKKVMTGPFVPNSALFLLDWDGISIRTNGPLFHLADEDGLEMLRLSTADSYEMRWRSWSEVLVDKLISQGRAPY